MNDKHLKTVNDMRKALTLDIARENADPERGISDALLQRDRRLARLARRLEARKQRSTQRDPLAAFNAIPCAHDIPGTCDFC